MDIDSPNLRLAIWNTFRFSCSLEMKAQQEGMCTGAVFGEVLTLQSSGMLNTLDFYGAKQKT
jgi:hypothetical protein